jgi:hypothetical protein
MCEPDFLGAWAADLVENGHRPQPRNALPPVGVATAPTIRAQLPLIGRS